MAEVDIGQHCQVESCNQKGPLESAQLLYFVFEQMKIALLEY